MTTKSFKSAIDRELKGFDYYSIVTVFQKEAYLRKGMKPWKTWCAIVYTGDGIFPYRVFYNFKSTMNDKVKDIRCETLGEAYEVALHMLR